MLVAKTESDLQLFGNPLWVEIDSDLPENALDRTGNLIMRTHRNAILCIAAVATLILVAADVAFAQRVFSRGPSSNIGAGGPSRGGGGWGFGGWGLSAIRD